MLEKIATSPEQEVPAQLKDVVGARQLDKGITLRVVLVCIALACFFGYVIPIIDIKLQNTYLGAQALPVGAVGVLLLLLGVNPLLRLLSAKLAFQRNEVLTIYITSLFSALVPGHGAEHYFVPNIIGAFYYSTRENQWLTFLQPYLKPWLSPSLHAEGGLKGPLSQRVTEGWYVGLASGQSIPWGAWLVPITVWSALILTTYFMWACLSVMLRAQWAEKEVLSFPLLRLPLAMTEDMESLNSNGTPFFRNASMWMGFALAVFIQGMNGLNTYFPDVPAVPLSLNTDSLLSETPWNQIGWLPVMVYPLVVGISYLLTAEISFSLWFFFLVFKAQLLVAYFGGAMPNVLPTAIGWAGPAPRTFVSFQQLGAYIVFFISIVWSARVHLRYIASRAFGRTRMLENERNEALSYPVAFWGFVLSFAFMVGWAVVAGMCWDIALALWSFYLICVVVLTRIVAESGMLYVQQGFTPLGTFAQLFGSGEGSWLAKSSLVPANFVQMSMIIDLRANLMPSFMHSFKLARERGINSRKLVLLIFSIILITYSLSIWQSVRLGYQEGGLGFQGWYANTSPQWSASIIDQLSNSVPGTGWGNWFWMGFGGAFTYLLMLARSYFAWFPVHPIGMLMGLTSPMYFFWFSIFLGWLAKVLITRFGGVDNYRKLLPAFLGLTLGDVSMMLFWLLVDGWAGRIGHQLLPG